MVIRPVSPADIPLLAAVQVASWQSAYRGVMPDQALTSLETREFEATWHTNLATEGRTDLACWTEVGLVGFVSFGPSHDPDADPTKTGEVYGIYFHPNSWGKGLGRAACQRALRDLADAGFLDATLWVLDCNHQARRFYERLGFGLEHDATKRVERFGVQLHHLRYRRLTRDTAARTR